MAIDPGTALAGANFVLGLFGASKSKKAADKAAAAAQEAANFNADIIERDLDILDRQSKLVDVAQVLREKRGRFDFANLQGSVVTGYAANGIDVASGTPMRKLRQNARVFEYDMAVQRFNDSVTQMKIEDAKENVKLTAELTRMEGGAAAGSLRAQGTQSLIAGIGSSINYAMGAGLFDEGAFRSSPVGITNFGRPQPRPGSLGSTIRI